MNTLEWFLTTFSSQIPNQVRLLDHVEWLLLWQSGLKSGLQRYIIGCNLLKQKYLNVSTGWHVTIHNYLLSTPFVPDLVEDASNLPLSRIYEALLLFELICYWKMTERNKYHSMLEDKIKTIKQEWGLWVFGGSYGREGKRHSERWHLSKYLQ